MPMMRPKKRPKLIRTTPLLLIVTGFLVLYAGLIYLALHHLTNSTVFLCLLGAMILLPPLLTWLLLHAFSGSFQDVLRELDSPEEDEAPSAEAGGEAAGEQAPPSDGDGTPPQPNGG